MIKRLGLFLSALLVSSVASAGIITDTVSQTVYVGTFGNHSYTHNLLDDGFVLGSALSGSIEIEIWDDNNRDGQICIPFLGCSDIPDLVEIIVITIDAFDFDTGGVAFGSFSNDLEVEALATVNATGSLDVFVQSVLGDFYVGNSVLTVVTAVPEPGTLSLLGLGLLGIGFARRRLAA